MTPSTTGYSARVGAVTFGVRMSPSSSPGRWSGRRRLVRRGTGTPYRKLQSIKFLLTRDRAAVARFLRADYPFPFSVPERVGLIRSFLRVTHAVRGYHTLAELLTVCDRIFSLADGRRVTVVEAGAGSGSSTAKLSLAVRRVQGRLVVFDSFRGIPENDEQHTLLDGRPLVFRRGAFRGRLSAVRKRIAELGALEVCELHKGLFEETLPSRRLRADVILLDVDLLSSTRTCVRHLFPQLARDGVLFSQDGHLRAIADLFGDDRFWRDEVGVEPPSISGLGVDKLLEVPATSVRETAGESTVSCGQLGGAALFEERGEPSKRERDPE